MATAEAEIQKPPPPSRLRAQMNVYIDPELRRQIVIVARQQGDTQSSFVARVLEAEVHKWRQSAAGIALDVALDMEREKAERRKKYRDARQAAEEG